MSESTYNSYIHGGQISPLVISIPSGQWSGSGSDYYISVTASNITADAILVPYYDKDSSDRLKGPVWCVPGSGAFTIHTTAIPTGTVTIMIQFIGIMGEAQYQVLADVYSKSQVDSIVAQSTAPVIRINNELKNVDTFITFTYGKALNIMLLTISRFGRTASITITADALVTLTNGAVLNFGSDGTTLTLVGNGTNAFKFNISNSGFTNAYVNLFERTT